MSSDPSVQWDVFLSFKNLGQDGLPTRDAGLAREVYQALSERGIRVFWSTVTLERLGVGSYKKAIDDALDAATVVVAVGTSAANLDSAWVRYEWDGFAIDILSGRKPGGQIFSYVEGTDPGSLPRTLRGNQVFVNGPGSLQSLGNFIQAALAGSVKHPPGGGSDSLRIPALAAATDEVSWLGELRNTIAELNLAIGPQIDMPWSPRISVWFGMIGVAISELWNEGRLTVRSEELRARVGDGTDVSYDISPDQWEAAMRCYYVPARHGNIFNFLLITPERGRFAIDYPSLAQHWEGDSAFRTLYPSPDSLRKPAPGVESEWCQWLAARQRH